MINEINPYLEKAIAVVGTTSTVPELWDKAIEICREQLEQVIRLLWMSKHLEIRQVWKRWIRKFDSLAGSNFKKFIRKVYLDICKTPYIHLYGVNTSTVFCFVINEYFQREERWRISQADILSVLQKIEPMSPNTISQVLSRKKHNPKAVDLHKRMKPFIDAYILWEKSPLLAIEEV